jgi:hypothetical protein
VAEADDPLAQTIVAVESVQNLDPQTIARTETLGRALDFTPAVPAFRRAVEFFEQIPLKFIPDLPDAQQQQLRQIADQFFAIFQSIMSFDPGKSGNAAQERDQLVVQIDAAYASAFASLYPLVSYPRRVSRTYRP